MAGTFIPQAAGDTVWVLIGAPPAAWYLALVNLWAFALMWFDKRRAGAGGRRVRERTLFFSAFIGGSLGAVLGMQVFRHKTRKWYFVWGMPLLLLVQAALAARAILA